MKDFTKFKWCEGRAAGLEMKILLPLVGWGKETDEEAEKIFAKIDKLAEKDALLKSMAEALEEVMEWGFSDCSEMAEAMAKARTLIARYEEQK